MQLHDGMECPLNSTFDSYMPSCATPQCSPYPCLKNCTHYYSTWYLHQLITNTEVLPASKLI
ncbi:hypothetical protein ZWY2020_026585, partial [Hordeum vulgare]